MFPESALRNPLCGCTQRGSCLIYRYFQNLAQQCIDVEAFSQYHAVPVKRLEGSLCGRAQRGFCTVYRFFSYPDRQRLRVSQVLVLPPFQRQGVGRALLEAVYALADSHNALDVTVRPNLHFLLLMDFHSCGCQCAGQGATAHRNSPFSTTLNKDSSYLHALEHRQSGTSSIALL